VISVPEVAAAHAEALDVQIRTLRLHHPDPTTTPA
jgi:hypothetical protein